MKAIISILLTLALVAAGNSSAADFFGVPDKAIVAKPPVATPAPAIAAPALPAPATPAPARGPVAPTPITSAPADEAPPTLLPDGAQLKTPAVGSDKAAARPFRDLGPNNGVLIGLEYTIGTTNDGAKFVESITPLYVRAAGKAHGTLRGVLKPGNPATVLEARPGFAIAAIEARGTDVLEAFRLTFMRYENGALDRAERYTSKWIGNESTEPAQSLRTDTRPIVGIYGKADTAIREFGLIVRREMPKAPAVAVASPFGTPVPPDPGSTPLTPTPDMPGEPPIPAAPLEPTAFDSAILSTPVAGGVNKNWGTPYRDLASPGAILSGFDYTVGQWNSKPAITSVRPVYLLPGGGKKMGEMHGTPDGESKRLDAKPGYAVGAIQARGGVVIDGFQLVFMKVRGAALDPADSYLGEWLGGPGGGQKRLDADGQPIVGLYGAAGKELNSLGIFVKKAGGSAPAPTISSAPAPLAPPTLPPPATGGVEIFACADDSFTLFHNGREILSGSNLRHVETGTFPIVKGDILTAVVKDKGGGGGQAWFSLRVVRDGKTILDAGDMRYLTSETLNWKINKLTTGFKDPKVWTHELTMGTDKRPRAAWAGAKDATATVLYLKGIVP